MLSFTGNFFVGATNAFPSKKERHAMRIIKPETEDTLKITVIDNRLKIENAPLGSKLEIYSVVGLKVYEIKLHEKTTELVVPIAKGYYIVRIGRTVRKIAIH